MVAGLHCGHTEVPEHAWEGVLFRYCPKAFAMLTDAVATFEQWNTGQLNAALTNEIAAQANRELGGYDVFPVLDVAAVTADIVGALGVVPTFGDTAAIRETTVDQLDDGSVFSVDGGHTWHVCAVVLYGSIAVYVGDQRGADAPTIRIDVERSGRCLVRDQPHPQSRHAEE